jgi:hypothetical protein
VLIARHGPMKKKLNNGDCSPWTERKNLLVATVRHGPMKKIYRTDRHGLKKKIA